MMEKARRGTKRGVVEVGLVKEKYNERSGTGAFSELETSLTLPRQGMSMYGGVGEGEKPGCTAFKFSSRARPGQRDRQHY